MKSYANGFEEISFAVRARVVWQGSDSKNNQPVTEKPRKGVLVDTDKAYLPQPCFGFNSVVKLQVLKFLDNIVINDSLG